MDIKLSKPFVIDGKEMDKIVLNLTKLTGEDILSAEKESRMRGNNAQNPLFSMEGLAVVAAKASDLKVEDLLSLPAPDFLLVTTR